MTNKKLAKIFYEIANLLEIKGVAYKPTTYRRATLFLESPREDFKIEKSIEVGKNCYEDVNGHIRRAWSEDSTKSLCNSFGLEIVEIDRTTEIIQEKETKFIHFVAKKK